MTMILCAHVGDYILLAADKRSMLCNLKTSSLQPYSDHEQKIRRWPYGAITTTGEVTFSNRIEQHFINHQQYDFRPLDFIYDELQRRTLEGIPIEYLQHCAVIYSLFNGRKTQFYSINIASFFNIMTKNGQNVIQPQIKEITKNQINIHCFKLPTDLSHLQSFQQKIKPFYTFKHDIEAIHFYSNLLKQIFIEHACIDPSISTTFDLYIQSCRTGKNVILHIKNFPQAQFIN